MGLGGKGPGYKDPGGKGRLISCGRRKLLQCEVFP